jgi:hypothetical protein
VTIALSSASLTTSEHCRAALSVRRVYYCVRKLLHFIAPLGVAFCQLSPRLRPPPPRLASVIGPSGMWGVTFPCWRFAATGKERKKKCGGQHGNFWAWPLLRTYVHVYERKCQAADLRWPTRWRSNWDRRLAAGRELPAQLLGLRLEGAGLLLVLNLLMLDQLLLELLLLRLPLDLWLWL